eukprot:NODE_1459_length_866_cov_354.705018_g1206_i0.p2 GENE.NODE_1459_length_866_cov_354.705018_g1206_i0~~NODE_1459_length_866_cov_354.705018_g1206_i0.p2  ORF type:complete len:173 (-),score=15.34 NODE_1459_length_866_cov_354.705018_g1206_i0:346-825(-)
MGRTVGLSARCLSAQKGFLEGLSIFIMPVTKKTPTKRTPIKRTKSPASTRKSSTAASTDEVVKPTPRAAAGKVTPRKSRAKKVEEVPTPEPSSPKLEPVAQAPPAEVVAEPEKQEAGSSSSSSSLSESAFNPSDVLAIVIFCALLLAACVASVWTQSTP